MTTKIVDQSPPRPNNGSAIQDLVIADIAERKGGAGRGFTDGKLVFDECMYLDADMMAAGLAIYLRQAVEERDGTE